MDSKEELKDRAYRVLSNFFTKHQDEVAEIEILPPAFQPADGISMQDGLNIGIPKKVLAMAFLKARELFFSGIKVDGPPSQLALEASRVILLFDPEYITAANFRKRRLLEICAQENAAAQSSFEEAVNREVVFLNSILTSPLHRQSKSPTLWHHRIWLLDYYLPLQLADNSGNQFLAVVRRELDAVCKSGERHPKNYYAWQYARRLHNRLSELYQDKSRHEWKVSYPDFLSTSALHVKAWCCRHPSDVSGWSFLGFLIDRLDSIPRRQEIVKQALEYAIKLQWDQESLWVFLRTVLADTTLREERYEVLDLLHGYGEMRSKTEANSITNSPLESNHAKAIKWIKLYQIPISSK